MYLENDNEIEIEILNNTLRLDYECWNCDCGKTEPVYKDDNGNCAQCKGTGYILTDLGRGILSLVNRYKERKWNTI